MELNELNRKIFFLLKEMFEEDNDKETNMFFGTYCINRDYKQKNFRITYDSLESIDNNIYIGSFMNIVIRDFLECIKEEVITDDNKIYVIKRIDMIPGERIHSEGQFICSYCEYHRPSIKIS